MEGSLTDAVTFGLWRAIPLRLWSRVCENFHWILYFALKTGLDEAHYAVPDS
jgi:hypothetical protein